ncbi:eukaryotic translation initiation factor 3 subunit B-like [Apostichopus japonicus]|uniref:eukaryotic translation initiation factor 3 subunit B-like n=1 Tax=Stichopus japonicus TaxID=307972 RepID=UPI003AB150E3
MAEGEWEQAPVRKKHLDRNSEGTDDRPLENGMDEEEPNFSDAEDFIDDVTDDELLGDLLKQKPSEAVGIDSVVVVDNIPQVGQERVSKLKNVIRKIFSKYGEIITEFYPEENGKTKGFIFLEYDTIENAFKAAKNMTGYKLDKSHTFAVNVFSDFENYGDIPDDWQPPEKQSFVDHGNLKTWLMDPDCHDQYSVIYDGGETTAIFKNTPSEGVLVEARKRWTETFVRWSPLGSFLATMHQKGIALWGGEKFVQIKRFAHPGVQLIDFSPCERYMVSFSPVLGVNEEPLAIIVWDTRTGYKKRAFHCETACQWPIFKWSPDGKFFARLSSDLLSIYETPSCGLLEKKSLKIPGIKDFGWSPSENILAYWTPEAKDSPARVTLLEIPSRKELRVKNLFNVGDCKMHWQTQGDYLCVKVDRVTKSKKVQSCNFEIFRIREKLFPVDSVELKEGIIAFAWEPVGSKFCVLHGEPPRVSASFYNIKTKANIELLKTMEKKQANSVFWSPTGQFVILAGLRNMNGYFEFIDTNDMTVMNSREHFMATDVEWDPSGRYVVTGVSWWSHKVDNAFWVWNFQGKLLQKCAREKFCQLLWRPRPKSLLDKEQVKEIKKNMKVYTKQFELKDRQNLTKASKEQIEKRQKMLTDFQSLQEYLEETYKGLKEERLHLRGGVDTDRFDSNFEELEDEEEVEFFLGEEITEIDEFEYE